MGASTYTKNNILKALLRGEAMPLPTNTYISLHTGEPGTAGANEGIHRLITPDLSVNFTASPTLSLYGNLNFSGDFNGSLSNRLISVPSGPPVTDPNNPLPPPTVTCQRPSPCGKRFR